MLANRIAEPTASIFAERPRATSTAIVARQTAAPANTLTVTEVSNIRPV